jgi:hypothetical protein
MCAIIVHLEPLSAVARQSPASVFIANHWVSNRAAASIRVDHQQAAQVLAPDFGASCAITNSRSQRSPDGQRSRLRTLGRLRGQYERPRGLNRRTLELPFHDQADEAAQYQSIAVGAISAIARTAHPTFPSASSRNNGLLRQTH